MTPRSYRILLIAEVVERTTLYCTDYSLLCGVQAYSVQYNILVFDSLREPPWSLHAAASSLLRFAQHGICTRQATACLSAQTRPQLLIKFCRMYHPASFSTPVLWCVSVHEHETEMQGVSSRSHCTSLSVLFPVAGIQHDAHLYRCRCNVAACACHVLQSTVGRALRHIAVQCSAMDGAMPRAIATGSVSWVFRLLGFTGGGGENGHHISVPCHEVQSAVIDAGGTLADRKASDEPGDGGCVGCCGCEEGDGCCACTGCCVACTDCWTGVNTEGGGGTAPCRSCTPKE